MDGGCESVCGVFHLTCPSARPPLWILVVGILLESHSVSVFVVAGWEKSPLTTGILHTASFGVSLHERSGGYKVDHVSGRRSCAPLSCRERREHAAGRRACWAAHTAWVLPVAFPLPLNFRAYTGQFLCSGAYTGQFLGFSAYMLPRKSYPAPLSQSLAHS
ncbi:hypothetical protein Bbelb_008450 [Branchiostoma belcheri]|nr:hypothetical protein Bbelb_008450 [Branchiostoma belcheri]